MYYDHIIYVIVIPWTQVVCLIYTPRAQDPQAQGLKLRQAMSAHGI